MESSTASSDGRRHAQRFPAVFYSLALLRRLNLVAMGSALAAVAAAIFALGFGTAGMGVVVGLPTLICGIAWAALLRRRGTLGKTKIRTGWVASIPLAMLNAALSAGLLLILETPGAIVTSLLLGAVLGVTYGALYWIPSLLLTLAFFGLPLLRAQRLADRGLAGEERGERIVGLASAALALLGLLLSADAHSLLGATGKPYTASGLALLYLLSALGLVLGLVTTSLGSLRERRRKRFVEQAESGALSGFRVDASEEGKVLVRVTSRGEGYRVADLEEELLALSEAGEAIEPLDRARRVLGPS